MYNTFIHGPSIYWNMIHRIQPDNGHLIDEIKTKLRSINVKHFGYSIITILTEFNNLSGEITNLGGKYYISDRQLDFWNSFHTMVEPEFHNYVKQQHDTYRETAARLCDPIDVLIKRVTHKQVNMVHDGTWNKVSLQQAQILSLTDQVNQTKTISSHKNRTQSSFSKPSPVLTPWKYPYWKLPLLQQLDLLNILRETRHTIGVNCIVKGKDYGRFTKKLIINKVTQIFPITIINGTQIMPDYHRHRSLLNILN